MEMTPFRTQNPICKKLQFLIGVPSRYIDNAKEYRGILVEIRRLCALRSAIMDRFQDINRAFYAGERIPEIQETARLVEKLSNCGIALPQEPSSLPAYLIELNKLIDERIEKVSLGFRPIPAEWIYELFHMPSGDTSDGVQSAMRKYRNFKNYYPFQRYVNWDFASTPEEKRSKNILGDDRYFMDLLIAMHTPKSAELFDFIGTREDVVVIVDCENSDAQRLYNTLRPVLPRLRKVILVDDSHSNALWAELVRDFIAEDVSVEHEKIVRLKKEKSLADLKIVARTYEEYYKNGMRNFVLASSDSDMWAVISGLPEADIMMLTERCKCGDALINAMTQNHVPNAFMENLQTDSTELMDRIVRREIKSAACAKNEDPRRTVLNIIAKLNVYPAQDTLDGYIREAAALCAESETANLCG